jgi:hypothetical protein
VPLQVTYSSVLALFLDLKDFGKEKMTLYRDLGVNDVIFKKTIDEVDVYARFRLVDSVGHRSIVPEVSDDPDRLEASVVDPLRYITFDTSEAATVDILVHWDEERSIFVMDVRNKEHWFYNGSLNLPSRVGTMFHQNPHVRGSNPNFRITGHPFIKCGA